jgi:hypothetical protein
MVVVVSHKVLFFFETQAVSRPSAVPTISAEDGLRLSNALLQVENITLKIQSMQAALQQAQDAAQKVVASLQKPGYTLQRGEKGEFIYVVDAPKAEKK